MRRTGKNGANGSIHAEQIPLNNYGIDHLAAFRECANIAERKKYLSSNTSSILPQGVCIAEEQDSDWSIDEFEWADPVGLIDHIQCFLNFREKKMNDLFEKRSMHVAS